MNFIFIAGINRSGGSLLARMFDGHKDISSYPMEVGFKFYKPFDFIDKITGTPTYIPDFNTNINPTNYFDAENENVSYEWGKETSSKFGVRKNYLEKAFYENSIKTNFDNELYIRKLFEYCKNSNSNQEFFEAKHKAYFESWDNGKYFEKPKYIVSHDSNGLFLSDFGKYFDEFKNSFVLIPIRDCLGYVAAEKTRIARRFFGSKRFSRPLPPKFLIKYFDEYDLNSLIRTWNISISRIKILQEKFQNNGRLITYRFEKLASHPNEMMNFICEKIGLKFNQILLKPTLCGKDWLGNSQQGKNNGINRKPNDYFSQILNNQEIEKVRDLTDFLNNKLKNQNTLNVDLTKIDDKYFFDISNQRRYSKDTDIWSLYCSLGFTGYRKLKLKKASMISIIAFLFGIIVKICHIPRVLKQKFLPGIGKQNYT